MFNLFVGLRLVQPYAFSSEYSLLPGPGGARAEAERRRALALKALDARIASTGGGSVATVAVAGTEDGAGFQEMSVGKSSSAGRDGNEESQDEGKPTEEK